MEESIERIGAVIDIVAQNQNSLAEQNNKMATYLLEHAVREKQSIPKIRDIVSSGPDAAVLPATSPEKRLEEIRGE